MRCRREPLPRLGIDASSQCPVISFQLIRTRPGQAKRLTRSSFQNRSPRLPCRVFRCRPRAAPSRVGSVSDRWGGRDRRASAGSPYCGSGSRALFWTRRWVVGEATSAPPRPGTEAGCYVHGRWAAFEGSGKGCARSIRSPRDFGFAEPWHGGHGTASEIGEFQREVGWA